MKNLIKQFLKFGIVGAISFVVDFTLYTVCNFLGCPYLISGIIGFVVSVIVNYLLSMKFVFERRDDMSRKKEFIIYVVLSTIGLGLNELLLYICVDIVYANSDFLTGLYGDRMAEIVAKVFATGVVMIYNFVSRKLILEKRGDKGDNE
jgi:Predicted membrane protein